MIASIDGSFFLHKSRFVAKKNDTPTRNHTILIFMRMLLNTLKPFPFTRVYIYFDRARSAHRLQLLPTYKANRKNEERDPSRIAYEEAREYLVTALPQIGFITVLEDQVEADDFAYLIAYGYEPGIHITEDRDWFGNLFPNWHIFLPRTNNLVSYTKFCNEIVQKTEKPRLIYTIARAIVGDRSDNIVGVRGVTWKNALPLAQRMVAREELGSDKHAKKVLENMDRVRQNINVINPVWVLHSDEAHTALLRAEQAVLPPQNGSLPTWREFCTPLEVEGLQGEFVRLWRDYNSIAGRLVYN